jgi:hypothetical protein
MLRYFLDEDVSYRVAEGLRARGIDALSVHDVRRSALSDEQQLTFSTEHERVLVTYNRADYQRLDEEWRAAGRRHSGILWCSERSLPRRSIGGRVTALQATATSFDSLQGICMPLVRVENR